MIQQLMEEDIERLDNIGRKYQQELYLPPSNGSLYVFFHTHGIEETDMFSALCLDLILNGFSLILEDKCLKILGATDIASNAGLIS